MFHFAENPEPYMYELKAVLIHRGPTAYSGHYIAHIKDKKNGAWYKFNDEEVEKMKGSNLQLGNEEEIELNPGQSSNQLHI
jgi:ubiquitin carboxyl-terminal hydrolase 48